MLAVLSESTLEPLAEPAILRANPTHLHASLLDQAMQRLHHLVLVVACAVQFGCRAPTTGFDPFGMGQTRVPPPPTGVVGRDDFSQSPLPPANAGAAMWPPQDYASPGNYWQRHGSGPTSLKGEASPSASNVADTPVREGDRLNWLDPASREIPGRAFEYGGPSVVAYPTAAGYSDPQSEYQPRLLPRTGSVTPLAAGPRPNPAVVSSPPRVRGFSHAGVQELRVPAELAEFQGNTVRQASGSTQQWQSRY